MSEKLDHRSHPPAPLTIGGKVVDGRTSLARRYKFTCEELSADLGNKPGAAQWLLIQRAAGLTVQIELLEASIVAGEAVDAAEHGRLVNVLVTVLRALNVPRRLKDVTGDIPSSAHVAAMQEVDQ